MLSSPCASVTKKPVVFTISGKVEVLRGDEREEEEEEEECVKILSAGRCGGLESNNGAKEGAEEVGSCDGGDQFLPWASIGC